MEEQGGSARRDSCGWEGGDEPALRAYRRAFGASDSESAVCASTRK
jgi:hypothetical protein